MCFVSHKNNQRNYTRKFRTIRRQRLSMYEPMNVDDNDENIVEVECKTRYLIHYLSMEYGHGHDKFEHFLFPSKALPSPLPPLIQSSSFSHSSWLRVTVITETMTQMAMVRCKSFMGNVLPIFGTWKSTVFVTLVPNFWIGLWACDWIIPEYWVFGAELLLGSNVSHTQIWLSEWFVAAIPPSVCLVSTLRYARVNRPRKNHWQIITRHGQVGLICKRKWEIHYAQIRWVTNCPRNSVKYNSNGHITFERFQSDATISTLCPNSSRQVFHGRRFLDLKNKILRKQILVLLWRSLLWIIDASPRFVHKMLIKINFSRNLTSTKSHLAQQQQHGSTYTTDFWRKQQRKIDGYRGALLSQNTSDSFNVYVTTT